MCVCVHACTCMYVGMHSCMYVGMYVCKYVSMHVYKIHALCAVSSVQCIIKLVAMHMYAVMKPRELQSKLHFLLFRIKNFMLG